MGKPNRGTRRECPGADAEASFAQYSSRQRLQLVAGGELRLCTPAKASSTSFCD
jgi:hypothetical protein